MGLRAPIVGAGVALVVVLASSCSRKAPGPAECRSFALSMFALRSEDDLSGASRRALTIRDQVDELTRECLTVPYDRAYLRCLEESGRTLSCRRAFERRRARSSEPAFSR